MGRLPKFSLCAAFVYSALLPIGTGADMKVAAASFCEWERDLGDGRPSYGNGYVFNFDTEDEQWFNCPLLRDDVTGGDGRINSLLFVVLDSHPTQSVR